MSKQRQRTTQGRAQEWARRVVERMGEGGYTPRRSKELARDLGVAQAAYPAFRRLLKDLESDGRVVRARGGRWSLPDGRARSLVGRLQIARAGFGFVLPEDPTLADIFIPEPHLGSALSGDRVRVELEALRGNDPRPTGRVVEVVERASARMVATVLAGGVVRPEDSRNPYDYRVEGEERQARPGCKVLFQITRWPGAGGEPAGEVLEVLGPAGEPGTETAAILAAHDAPGPFPESVKREVRNLRREPPARERAQRLDLTGLLTLTIDPESARDFDDALSFEPAADGGCVVGVHIADVSYHVKPGSRLDEEARARSTSIYLPERVIPMLPEELANDLCSLRPDEERLTKTVFLRYDADGECAGFTIHRSRIRSRRRLTYQEVRALLEADGRGRRGREDPQIMAVLRGLHGLAQRLRGARLRNGGIELCMPEFQVRIDAQGRAAAIERVENDFSHQLVEEFMLAANVAVAQWCAQNGMPVLHRVHEAPAEEELAELAGFLAACGYALRKPYRREWLNAILQRVQGRPEEHAVNLAVLKSFKQAVYSPQADLGHFALNFPRYLHFTSPIRRYPDLHLHQMLDAVFTAGADKLPRKLRKRPPRSGKALEKLGLHTSSRERRAMKIEEAVKDFRRLEYLAMQKRRVFKAVVTGIRKFGVFVEIEDYYVEGMLPRAMLEAAGFATREEKPGKAGARSRRHRRPGFHLGQEVRVKVTAIDLAARTCEMTILRDRD